MIEEDKKIQKMLVGAKKNKESLYFRCLVEMSESITSREPLQCNGSPFCNCIMVK